MALFFGIADSPPAAPQKLEMKMLNWTQTCWGDATELQPSVLKHQGKGMFPDEPDGDSGAHL